MDRRLVVLPLLLALAAPGACGRRAGEGGGTGGLGGGHGPGGRPGTGGAATGGAATGGAATGGVGSGGRTTAGGGGRGGGAPAGSTGGLGTGGTGTGGAPGTAGASGAGGGGLVDAGADLATDASLTPDASAGPALGMNDVTILAPLPSTSAAPVLLRGSDLGGDGAPLVPRALFDRLVVDGTSGKPLPTLETAYERLHLIAVRFDLCDRHLPGPCPSSEDGRLRLVFQPLSTTARADDVGFHAFYSIRNDELAGAVAELRELARGAAAPGGPLRASPALTAADPTLYAEKVRAFVRRYGGNARLVRLTINAQDMKSAAFRWILRGVEKKDDAFVDMPIVGGSEVSEIVFTSGGASFDVQPVADTPPGLLGAIVSSRFNMAEIDTQRGYLAALTAVDNPLTHTPETVPCVACHVSTLVLQTRATSRGIDPLMLPGRYTSAFDLSTAGGKAGETQTVIRALGYRGDVTLISQRVVNETAQVLAEIEARFPARP